MADHLKLGARLNPGWDGPLARRRIDQLDLDPRRKAGKLSGGQRAQLALTIALGKRPELLILDEPVASLDPLARREFLQDLMETVAEDQVNIVLSSHLISDLERVCDYLVVLADSRVQIAGPVDELLAAHHLLSGPRRDEDRLPAGMQVISGSHTTAERVTPRPRRPRRRSSPSSRTWRSRSSVPAAKVIINARTGSIVMNQAVTLDACAVAHGNLTVTIQSDPIISQPAPLSNGRTVVTERTSIDLKQDGNGFMPIAAGARLADVVRALNTLGATPQDLLAILQAMKSAGALKAEIEII